MQKFIKSIPMAICGIALAIASLGNLLALNGFTQLRAACGILSAVVLIIYLMKLVLDFPHANAELKTPIPLSVMPTATMTLMLLAVYVRDYLSAGVAVVMWYASLAAHIAIMGLFIKRFVVGFKLGTVFPTWFVAGVGIVTASVTAPAFGAQAIGQIIFYIGFVLYPVVVIAMILRMRKVRVFPEPALPTMAIFTAPPSLLTVGYFQSFAPYERITAVIYILLGIAFISYICVTVMMVRLLKIKFYPTYAAFGFPYVISATAFRAGNDFLITQGYSFFAPIMHISFIISIAMVLFIIVHYVRYFNFWLRF